MAVMTMTRTTLRVLTATATRQGTGANGANNADGVYVHVTAAGPLGAAVVDMIGHGEGIDTLGDLLATVIARTAARRRGLPAILTATELIADSPANGPAHDGVAIVAMTDPTLRGPRSRILEGDVPVYLLAWVGDAEARTWDGSHLEIVTTPHTVGEQLRGHGFPLDVAAPFDDWIRTTLRQAMVSTVNTLEVDARKLLVLTSDGVAGHLPEGRFAELVAAHIPDPAGAEQLALEDLAAALVEATEPDAEGYRDDATVCLLLFTAD